MSSAKKILLLFENKKKLLVISDSFNRANGVIGVTDGTAYPTIQGKTGIAWSADVGTWAINTNKASETTVSGGSFYPTVIDSGYVNCILQADIYLTGAGAGIVARYVDVNNFIRAWISYPNILLDKVVGGSPTTLIMAAAGYEDNETIRLIVNGTKFKLYYKGSLVGTEQTIDDAALQTSTKHGIAVNTTDNRVDNFIVWTLDARGFLGL
jgi:hypothetical protein